MASSALLASKIVIVEPPPGIRNVPGVPTAVAGFVGIAERGPMSLPTFVTSFEEYNKNFGGFIAAGVMTLQVRAFFQNGGTAAWIVRTAHHSDITDQGSNTAANATATLVDRAGSPLPTLTVAAKTPGAFGNGLKITIVAPTNGEADKFNILVALNGVLQETFPNVSMTDADERFVENIINQGAVESDFIIVTDLDSGTSSPDDLPALGDTTLTTGSDGLTSLDDSDFIGDSAGGTGLNAFDTVQTLNLIAIPDRITAAVANAMITYAEVTRQKAVFAVLDPPAGLSATAMVTYTDTTAALVNLSEFGAIYWPQVKIVNPSKLVFGSGDDITIAPSGTICGVYARVDGSTPGGVYIQPAGIENGILFGVIGFETQEVLDEAKRDLVFPKRINPLVVFPGTPRHIDGARTLKGNGNFPSIGERRGVIFIEQSIKGGILFAKNANNTEALRETVRKTIVAFLLIQMSNGAFRSDDPSQAFFVDVSAAINPPSVIFANQLRVKIGLATNKPAEFIIVFVSQDERALQEELATSGAV